MGLDLKLLTQQVSDVLAYSQMVSKPLNGVPELIDDWYNAKEKFLKLFNNKLIYEVPETISFDIGEAKKLSKVSTFCDEILYKYNNTALSNFVFTVKKDFYSNILSEDYIDEYGKIIVKKGTKIIKAFKYFEKDKELLTLEQNEASMILQEDKISGKLCFSIHPLDFLSSSENSYNWRSCHALDGDYRAGNLSYMVDSSTVICYLKSEEDASIPGFPFKWNNKKWRMLLFFSKDNSVLFAGRQYPFFSDSALEIIKKEVTRLCGNFYKLDDWSNSYLSNYEKLYANGNTREVGLRGKYACLKSRLIDINDIVKERPGSKFYNDLLYSNYYTPYYTWNTYNRFVDEDRYVIELGGKCKCIKCGNDYLFNSGSMYCRDCELSYGNLEDEEIVYCACCGSSMYLDDVYTFEDDGSYYCYNCHRSLGGVCENCGASYLKIDLKYDRKEKQIRCKYCHTNYYDEGEE